jgi:peroxiredoxin
MSTSRVSRLEAASNIAVIIASVILVAVLVRHEWPGSPPGSPKALEGATVNLGPLTNAPVKRNLVLFISENCHFCEQEMPFYRTLRDKLPSRVSLVAVFPQHEPEPERFLAARSIKVDHVASSDSLSQIGVTGTPTLLLVDERGKVKHVWLGAQPDAQHEEIVASIARDL